MSWLWHPRWWLYELGLRRQALRRRAWRCVLLGHRSVHFSAFCMRCGDLVL